MQQITFTMRRHYIMPAIKRELENTNTQRRRIKFLIGDRIITSNSQLGTVVRTDRDENGDFVVVQLDILPHEFAYDPWDLEKM